MQFRELTLKERREWSRLLASLPLEQRDIYYTPEYYELFEQNGDGQATCFVFENDKCALAIYPFLINSVNDLGFDLEDEHFDIQGAYGYNGVVASEYTCSFRRDFIKSFDQYCIEKNIIAEFVRFNPMIGNHFFGNDPYSRFHYEATHAALDTGATPRPSRQRNRRTVVLDLKQPYELIWKTHYSSTNRNMIRKGASTLTYTISQAKQEIDQFFVMYIDTMSRIGADSFYFFSKEFFDNLLTILSDECFVFTAFDANSQKPIGGLLLLVYEGKAHYFLAARSNSCSNNSMNNYLLDQAVKFAIDLNCTFMHLGGGSSAAPNNPLFKFKKNFSRDLYDVFISQRVINHDIYHSVCDLWERANLDKAERYRNFFLRYHK
jgi:hypothetical protein